MMLRIGIEQSPNHTLILGMMFPCLILEEFDTSLAQRDGDLDAFVPKDQIFRPGQEVRNDLDVSERFVGVFDFPAHTCAYLSASSQLQRYE